tara:strand:- start:700 stop:1266 length:567 start_codon:yes stop_codon:yes gene_type:complete
MKPRDLKPEERALWRKVAKTAKPLDASRLAALHSNKPAPTLDKSRGKTPVVASRTATPLDVPTGPKKTPAKPPAPENRGHERRLRRGQIEIEARIDLHGMRQVEARAALGRFLNTSKARGLKTVLVITGKGARLSGRARGLGEAEPGVLRRVFLDWLSEPDLRPLVTGYAPSNRRHGGDGAFYVTLKS